MNNPNDTIHDPKIVPSTEPVTGVFDCLMTPFVRLPGEFRGLIHEVISKTSRDSVPSPPLRTNRTPYPPVSPTNSIHNFSLVLYVLVSILWFTGGPFNVYRNILVSPHPLVTLPISPRSNFPRV